MRKLSIVAVICCLVSLSSCGFLMNLFQVPESDTIPNLELILPAALLDQNAPPANASGANLARFTDGAQTRTIFNPFRKALRLVQNAMDEINSAIGKLNAFYLPASGTIELENGDTALFSTDENRELSRRVELRRGDITYLQVDFENGSSSLDVVFDVQILHASSAVEFARLSYDGSGSAEEPILEGELSWLAMAPPFQDEETRLFFRAEENGDLIRLQGGLGYNFFFDDDDPATGTGVYMRQHVYMFQAIATSGTDSRAYVKLFFPEATVDTIDLVSYSLDASFATILWNWAKLEDNGAVIDLLSSAGITIDPVADFRASLTSYFAGHAGETTDLSTLAFILNLANPVAYDASVDDGFVANGVLPADYLALADAAELPDFTRTPAQIAALSLSLVP